MVTALNKSRCLILSCSQRKSTLSQPLSAIDRYTGPSYQVLNKFLREQPHESNNLDIYILSARYGLIRSQTPTHYYDQKMTSANAAVLRRQVLHTFEQQILPKKYAEIFVSMGKTYLLALDDLPTINEHIKLIISQGSSGKKLTELRNWLWGCTPAASQNSIPLATPNLDKQTAVLRGHSVTMTTAAVLSLLQDKIEASNGLAFHIQSWYVEVDGARISPKWAAQVLFNLPVSEFSADEARRVLRRLGLNCYQI